MTSYAPNGIADNLSRALFLDTVEAKKRLRAYIRQHGNGENKQ